MTPRITHPFPLRLKLLLPALLLLGLTQPSYAATPGMPGKDTIYVSTTPPATPSNNARTAPQASEGVNRHGIHLKVNALGYLALIFNASAEFELGHHLSISVPLYYSGWDELIPRWKLRTAGTQPELRYYFNDNYMGAFVGAHASFAWYNMATGGEFRYQDRNTNTPTIGGGISGGYRISLEKPHKGRHPRWTMEFSIGLGFLPLRYDTFYNVPNGALAQGNLYKAYWGIDHAGISVSYRFGRRTSHE